MNDTTTDAGSFFAPLRKRWWLVLVIGAAVGLLTYVYYKRQPATFIAKTQLYLAAGSEQGAGGGSGGSARLSGRSLADQVELINSAVVGLPVRKRLKAQGDLKALKGKEHAAANASNDFITISTEARSPRAAVTLANAYAVEYLHRQRANFQRGLRNQIATDRQQLRRIETPPPSKGSKGGGAASGSSTIQAATLASKINTLESQLAGSSGVEQVSTAKATPLPVSPQPKKNAIFGLVLGLLLGAIAVSLSSRFNRRLGSLSQVESAFGQQILTALPKVKNPIVTRDGVRMPSRPLLEPLRRLATSLQLAGTREGAVGQGPRSVLFLSPESGDGKSTVVANLARVLRDAGARVVVVEADFRRPIQARLLDADTAGLTEVLAGTTTVEQLAQAQAARAGGPVNANEDGAPAQPPGALGTGSLTVLPGSAAATNPPALLASDGMRSLLRSLCEEYDYVLIDAPSLLEVSDAMPLLPQVEGIVLVARIGHTRDASAQRLMSTLSRATTAPILGVVANCPSPKDAERYGFAAPRATTGVQPKLLRR
jgi:Mrp family chromosome partitioning ATPase/capsular polysaccharide biosynthesis protein